MIINNETANKRCLLANLERAPLQLSEQQQTVLAGTVTVIPLVSIVGKFKLTAKLTLHDELTAQP